MGVKEAKKLLAMEEEEFARRVNAAIWAEDEGGSAGWASAGDTVRKMAGKYT